MERTQLHKQTGNVQSSNSPWAYVGHAIIVTWLKA